ncbi:MAG: flagellar biosynthetic protein FliO [Stenotrophomonas sp.]|uniref:flagellar biosynthetic protein FliO n=1 Tax=Stenotrophomonas sp. TaxID=69392 RepID=UPI003D6CF279
MIALLALAAPAVKAATPVGQHAASTPSMFGAVFMLLVVLGLIIGLGWVLKRLPGGAFRPAEGLKVIASINVGAKERVVVVDVNGQQLLLGVTAGGISALHTLPEPLPQTPPPALPNLKQLPNFAQLLSQKLRKDS